MSKYEKTIIDYPIKCDDISLYPYKLAPGLITYGGKGVEEKKDGLIARVRLINTTNDHNLKDRAGQVVIEIEMDEYHVEKILYATKEHKTWNSQGKVIIDYRHFINGMTNFCRKCRNYERKGWFKND